MTAASGRPGPRDSGSEYTVLYLAGWGRSGSTLVGSILGELPGAAFLGELRYLWDRGLLEDRLCGCGFPFGACEFWRDALPEFTAGRVRHEAPGATPAPERSPDAGQRPSYLETLVRQRDALRTRELLWTPRSVLLRRPTPQPFGTALRRLYASVAQATGERLLVDSSKVPAYALLLERELPAEIRVLHLVRDPRATAHSWSKHRKRIPDAHEERWMESPGTGVNAAKWSKWNLAVEKVWGGARRRYACLRYEDLVRRPRTLLRRALERLGVDPAGLPFTDESTVELGTHHTIAGNPGSRTGLVEIEARDAWRDEAAWLPSAVTTALTLPLLMRYGYPLDWRQAGGKAPGG